MGIVAVGLFSVTASAGPIVVEIDGVQQTTTYDSGDAITLDLGAISVRRGARGARA